MDQTKFQIFISSTQSDLIVIRKSLTDAILQMNHFPVGMEQFSADDEEQWATICRTLEQTDYYVCIIGHRYGSMSERDGISFTEKEWDYAKKLGIPIMSFVQKRDVYTKPSERDDDPEKLSLLSAFIEKVTAEKMVEFWERSEQLNTQVVVALMKIIARKPRLGWKRSQSLQVAEELAKLLEENRSLRDQVDKLTATINKNKPCLEVDFDEAKRIELKFIENSDLKLEQLPYLPTISWAEFPTDLKRYSAERKINRYNASIPSEQDLKVYVAEVRKFQRTKLTANSVTISVRNVGSSKAREVHVDLEFPSSVLIVEQDDWRDLKKPVNIIPSNPLKDAEEEKDKLAIKSNWHTALGPRPHFDLSDLHLSHTNIAFQPRTSTLRVEGNTATVWIENLLHTREISFSTLKIVPLEIGSFEVSVTIICEEFTEPFIAKIPLIVTRGTISDLVMPNVE